MPEPVPHSLRRRRWPALAALALGLFALLPGCDVLMGPTQVSVLGGAVTIAAPMGYCVSPGEVQQAQDTAVVLIGRCLSTGFVTPAVISASVGRAGSAGVMVAGDAALAGFFGSAQGRKLLARSGRASDVAILETRSEAGAFLMHLNDRQAGKYWRAILGLNGRLITVSAVGTGGLALSEAASLTAVEQTLAAVRQANPAPASPPAPSATAPPA